MRCGTFFFTLSVGVVGQFQIKDYVTFPDAKQKLNLTRPNAATWSQKGQDIYIDEMLHGMKGGFIVEAGAFDGETLSNSLFFEVKRGWSCLLVEPDPETFAKLQAKHRQCVSASVALSPTQESGSIEFEVVGGDWHGGRTIGTNVTASTQKEGNLRNVRPAKEGPHKITVPTFPISNLFAEAKKTTVDVLVLDVDSIEAQILSTIDFNKIEVGVICVEAHKFRARKIDDLLTARGFQFVEYRDWDSFYANPSYFKKHNLPMPALQDKSTVSWS